MTKTYTLNELSQVAAAVLQYTANVSVVAFYGEMGVGKTTLIKEICSQLGVVDTVTSPTFALINEYQCSNGNRIAHFDFYRLKNIEEALQLGVEEYFDSPNICLIEWPELIESLLPADAVRLHLSVTAQGTRQISDCGSGSV